MDCPKSVKKPNLKRIFAPEPDSIGHISRSPSSPGGDNSHRKKLKTNLSAVVKADLSNLKKGDSQMYRKTLEVDNGKELETRTTFGTKMEAEQSQSQSHSQSLVVRVPKKRPKMDGFTSKKCYLLLKKLMDHKHGWAFTKPLEPVAFNYISIVSHPMDLGTIESKLKESAYIQAEVFGFDVKLIFSNAMRYYHPSNEVYQMAEELNRVFVTQWRSLVAALTNRETKVQNAVMVKDQLNGVEGRKRVSSKDVESRRTDIIRGQEENRSGDCSLSTLSKPRPADSRDFLSLAYGSQSKEERAEMLKKRFAETILKAKRQTVLDQHTNVNFDSREVEHEIQRLEKKQHEDRIRIEAEMKTTNVGGESIRMACADVGLSHSSVRIPSVKIKAVSSKDVPRRIGIKAQEENRIGDNKVSLSCRNSMKTREPRTSAQHKEALHTKSVPVSTLSRKRKTLEKCEVKCRFKSPVNNACHETDSGARRLVEEPAYSISQVTSTSYSAAHAEPRTSTQHKEALYTKSVTVSTLSGKRKTLEKCDVKCSSKSPMNNVCLESDSGARPLLEESSYNISQVTSTSYSAAQEDCESLSYGSLLSPSEEQRAEMLQKRFVETIFKAQRKNLNVKFDSLKVQQEKERLERIQCEERARIEAEMKASKIKLETELSNRRQQEREAARMALEKMERSVEFVDNTSILRELAKLIGDNSFGGPLRGSGGMYVASSKFANGKLKSPLERLGLFLKDDYASVDDFDELKKIPKWRL